MKPVIACGAAMLAPVVINMLPAATWMPAVRRPFRVLAGVGRHDHVALTFDDGPHPATTPALLDALSALEVSATFFVLGARLAAFPELGRELVSRGHEIAVHGWTHRNLLGCAPRRVFHDLGRTREAIRILTGQTPTWYRPPYGALTTSGALAARRLHLQPILWTAWGYDWRESTTATDITRTVLAGLRPHGTILLHDAPIGARIGAPIRAPIGGSHPGGRRDLEALARIVEGCRSRGMDVGRLAEHFA